MRFELTIARRYLLTKRENSFISVISLFSVLGVGLGVAALIVTMAVMSGFSTEFRDKLLGLSSHVIVGVAGSAVRNYPAQMEKVAAVEGVTAVTPIIYSEVMLAKQGTPKGVILRGIDLSTASGVLTVHKDMVDGRLEDLERADGAPGIVLGSELASRLGVSLGSTVNVLTPSLRGSAVGFTPKVKVLQVVGVFKTHMYEYDSSSAFVSLSAAQEMLGFKPDAAMYLDVRLKDPDAAPRVAERIVERLGGMPVYARTWIDMNGNIFAALKLEQLGLFVVLLMIVLVGSFSIITSLVLLVMEKTRDIAILMSMGATADSIRRIFLLQGSIIGAVGTALGLVLGICTALALKRFQFIKLPPDVYPMDTLPVLLNWHDIVLIAATAFGLCFLSTLYPASRAAKLKPVEALRHE
ncbi:Lipoprotein-releasing system transmembrane protein LolC [Fundidesulfovibrio magnetotacticus]|uniref:Lipoprotein-releasing system transmembrane protein LolC n=1 Tax=Fundidesulfovibrio magnetotacticus TaxID=2730080 RepID=A0A6V8LKU0_9BACT|nr:lipoprotein-releasing ABC transporter permease subunit [Fundidesulfovibrio magnetotacticus]GFK93312.1 Lipoprotein-releasing system transmembrane protein LolC [Fundidesulfovibrio magnetotacticus]